MTKENPEYQALHRVVTADKRQRKFVYTLTIILFLAVLFGLYQLERSIDDKINQVVAAATTSSLARQKDNKTISEETTRYITCIFVLPIEQRTPANQEACFRVADLPGGLTRGDFSPIIVNPDGTVAGVTSVPGQPNQLSSGSSVNSSSSNTTSPSKPKQSNPSQPPATTPTPPDSTLDKLPLVGGLFKRIGL